MNLCTVAVLLSVAGCTIMAMMYLREKARADALYIILLRDTLGNMEKGK